ncbi:hypothetical protein A4K06_09570 [Salmonella enterica subsp. enterica serovar Chester]|nr:hypothetical protein [Salmonella enterica subsp. enterica serovar Chester]
MAKTFKLQLIEAVKAKNPDTASALTVDDVDFGTVEAHSGSGGKVYTVKVNEGHIKFLAGTIATFTYTNPAPEKVALSGLEGELDGFTAPGIGKDG